MHSSKYATLEGYDFNSSEFYETQSKNVNENEKALYNTIIEEQNTEDIDSTPLKSADAFKKFSQTEHDQLSNNKLDYLGCKIQEKKSIEKNETMSQQLLRLIQEVEDLKQKTEESRKAEENEMRIANTNEEDPNNTQQTQTNESNMTTSDEDHTTTDKILLSKKSKLNNISTPSVMLNQISKLQSELEKLSLGIVDNNNTEIDHVENMLIQKKMINQIKNCKINTLKESLAAVTTTTTTTTTTTENNTLPSTTTETDMEVDNPKNEDSSTTPITLTNNTNIQINTNHNISTINNGSSNDNITYQLYYSPKYIKYQNLAKLSDLEERINQIEKIIGIHDMTDDSIILPSNNCTSTLLYAKGNIVTAIDSLDQQLQLLSQPKNFNSITLKINDTVKELEQFMNLQKNKMDGEDNRTEEQLQIKEKVNYIYSKLESTDEYSSIISPLLVRLKTLQALHTEAAQFSEDMQMLAEQQKAMKMSIKNLEDMIKDLTDSLEVNKQIIEGNIDSISGRIDQLLDRIKEL